MAAVTWYAVLAGGRGGGVPHYSDLEVHLHF